MGAQAKIFLVQQFWFINSIYGLKVVSEHFSLKNMLNGAWYVKYGWKDLPLDSKIQYSIQWISLWKYEKKFRRWYQSF